VTNLFVNLQNALYNLRDRQEGQTMAEYALVLALIAAVTAAIFITLGDNVKAALDSVIKQF
jgi:Flp pilus assembly pilin Flp